MHIALTLYRGLFWVPFGRGSQRQCYHAADIAERTRGERTRIISQNEWDKEQVARRRERADAARADRHRKTTQEQIAAEHVDLLRAIAAARSSKAS